MSKKKWVSGFVAVLMLITILFDGNAAVANKSNANPASIVVHEESTVEWNKRFTFIGGDTSYFTKDKMLYVDYEVVNEAFNLNLVYDASTKTLSHDKGSTQAVLQLGSNKILLNNVSVNVSHPVSSSKNSIYVPMVAIEKIVNGKAKYVQHTTPLMPDKLAIDNSMKQVMKQRDSNLDKALAALDKANQSYENAVNENRYDIEGELRHGFSNTMLWGTARSLSSHQLGDLSNSNNIVILNPDKSNMTGDWYSGYHYYVKKGTAYNRYNQKVPVFYYGAPSKAIQKNIAAKKKVVDKAKANVKTYVTQYNDTSTKWVDSIYKHYNAKGGAKNPQVLAQMVIHFNQLYETTEIELFKNNKDRLQKQLLKSSQVNYWLADHILQEHDFEKRFTSLLAKNKGAALSVIYSAQDFKMAAFKLYAAKHYQEAMSAAQIARANGINTNDLIEKISYHWEDPNQPLLPEQNKEEYEAFLKEQEQERINQENEEKRIKQEKEQERTSFEKWGQEYIALLKRFNQDFTTKYGNMEYVNGLSYQQKTDLAQEIVKVYKQPMSSMETRLAAFKYESTDAMKDNLSNLKSAIEQLEILGDEEKTRIAAAHLDLALFTAGLIE
ncbi:stalk domain-containing protein [Paenibacillus arenosi]|uniref:Copper amine oxidase-like N-terminal domain-containing protein n=1 Tax=Paenibacillus arenosi TaxID=2774142 RepID=A0ABR9AVY2_9BACL|nr:stalk domain-containing protein [Paenibacillus arenosi]MBD8497392.1 hypothetical protein [Paenibacillus arenosi]